MKRKAKVHYRLVPSGPPPFPATAWTRCGKTVPYERAQDEIGGVTCLMCMPFLPTRRRRKP